MRIKPNFVYENGRTICALLDDKGRVITGIANCHPDDADMASEKTGCEIAFKRARINAYRNRRDDLKSQLSALNQLYYSMNMSKYFNPNSYENKMLQRQIHLIKMDLDTIKELLTTEQQNLREYIQKKDEFYKRIRANRKKAKSKE